MISGVESVREQRLIFIHRYLWRIAIFALAAFGFAWLFTHSYTTLYKAETELAFKTTKSPVKFDIRGLLGNMLPFFMEDDIYSECYDIGSIITSENIARRVLERNNLLERLYDPETMKPYSEWFDDFHGRLMFKVHKHTSSMTIAYAAETPELAKEITQLFAEEFEKYFSTLYWQLSLADGIQDVVDRRQVELAEIHVMINELLVEEKRLGAKRSTTQDIADYLIAEKGKLLTKARCTGYQQALDVVDKQIELAYRGEDFEIPHEILLDYVLVFLKSVYRKGNLILVELEADFGPDHPEIQFWNNAMDVTTKLITRVSAEGAQTAYNTLVMRGIESQVQYEFWSERADKLRVRVEGLPRFEEDVTWLLRKQKMLEFTFQFWDKRLAFQRYGEDMLDDPFIVLDEPIVPDRAFYPILKVWIYAFPVLLVVGSLVFLMRYKIEQECIDDIKAGR